MKRELEASFNLSPDEGMKFLYLDLLKKCLVDFVYIDDPMSIMVLYKPKPRRRERVQFAVLRPVLAVLKLFGLQVVRPARQVFFDYSNMSRDQVREHRINGMDWPTRAHTMIGLRRLDNLQACIETVLQEQVPGDFLETGVWRGGASILVKGVLEAYGDRSRCVWLADSFRGLPPPNVEQYPADRGSKLYTIEELAISLADVRTNFEAYGLLDDRVRFLEGWFRDTLPDAPIERLSVLRLDGDLYESTIQALDAMYHRVSPGGFVIVDDYNAIPACREAVEVFRNKRSITEPTVKIDQWGVYWRKESIG